MRFMASLAGDGVIGCVDGGRSRYLASEAGSGVTAHAGFAARSGRIARCDRVSRVAPFHGLNMMGGGSVTLSANTRIECFRDQAGIAAGTDMRAARSMAVLALDVGYILQRFRHGFEVAWLRNGRRNPSQLLHDIVKPAIRDGIVRIISNRVASPARGGIGGAVGSVDVVFEDFRMERFLPRVHLRPRRTGRSVAVAKRASPDSRVGAGRQHFG